MNRSATRRRANVAGVIETRLDALRAAIIERDWEQVEFQYDRVRRSCRKMDGWRADEARQR